MKKDAVKVGFALCGSFCTFSQVFKVVADMVEMGYDILPIMSANAYETDTRFGQASEHVNHFESITGKKVIHTLAEVEPIGPERLVDVIVIAPCTGNTIAKLAGGIIDTPVVLAAKSQLRNARPVIIAPSTNDALSGNAGNLGKLLNTRHYYFVPFGQDDPVAKNNSMMSRFELIPDTIELALEGRQIQPMLICRH